MAYVDWEQQEFAIAAALSVDRAMSAAYTSGDPYLAFAKQAGAVPPDATKASHKQQRDQFKVCALAVQYGMAERSLAQARKRDRGTSARTATVAPANLSDVLALEPSGCRSCDVARLVANGVRLAGTRRAGRQSAEPRQFPDASQWRRNAAAGVLSGNGTRDSRLRPRA